MKRALASDLNEDAVPAMVLHASGHRLRELFPVRFSTVDPFAEAEPSEAALVQLASGPLVAINFGTITNRVTVSVPVNADLRGTIKAFLREVPVRRHEIVWIVETLREELESQEMLDREQTAGVRSAR